MIRPTRLPRPLLHACAATALLVVPTAVLADEGMWTLDNFPAEAVATKYGVRVSDEWLRHTQLSTVRLENGCTGSFVSPDGLILTNNHCTWSCIRNLSSDERNLSETGFLARSQEEELQCPGQRISVLVALQEVTDEVADAIAGLAGPDANDARKGALTRLEAACEDDSGLRCEAVSLYNGGQYFLYKYRRYDDVRLVFAPELAIAAFGGDPDNFNFPRWCLDMSFLRAYEDGKPADTPHYFEWRGAGPETGDPVFVAGHPGSTSRQLTLAQLKFLRNVVYPAWLIRRAELRGRLLAWADTGDSAARAVQQRILGIENGIKVRRNRLLALLNDEMMARKAEEERELRSAVMNDRQLARRYGDAWELIEGALEAHRNFYDEHLFIEEGAAFTSDLFDYARDLVRGTAEREKPNEERLREYTETALPRVESALFAGRPIDEAYEKLTLEFSLDKMREYLGPDSRYVQMVLGDASPGQRAAALVDGTRLADVGYRRELWEGGVAAVRASDDPMIELALAIDDEARALRQRYEDQVEAPVTRGEEMIADARFRIYGTDIYPDATFTLRITYGAVEGWTEKGEPVAPFTRTARLFERATGEPPFALPDSWRQAREQMDPETPFNFVATTDITGGNSGSPVIAADGALVGLAFDGNIHSIAGSYWFDPELNRTVAVDAAIMLEALEKVYRADRLLDELTIVN